MVETPVNPLHILAGAPLFRGLQTAELEVALEAAHYRRIEADHYFFHQGDRAKHFYIILDGRARLTQLTPEGHQVIIRYMGPGDGMGIIVALSKAKYPLSCEAITECVALCWDYQVTTHLMERFPSLAVNGLRMVGARFQDLQNRYWELATERVERRVARALIRLTSQAGKKIEGGLLIDFPLSRQDLAEMTGTTLYSVSRILSQWEQAGIVETGRERVIIRSPHDLVVIAEDLPK